MGTIDLNGMSNKSKVKVKLKGQWNVTVLNAIKCSQNLRTNSRIKFCWRSAIILTCFSDKMHPVHLIKFGFVPDFGEVVAESTNAKLRLMFSLASPLVKIVLFKTDLIFDKNWLLVSVVSLLSVSFPFKAI